jgi:4-amino-4-deoxy-L-arabinose transferase-like glycosyltransferase
MTARRGWLAGVIVLAAVLRLFPIWFGLPYPEARPDEETAVAHAVNAQHGDLNPRFFHWPSLTFYLFAAGYAVAAQGKRIVSLAGTLSFAEHILIGRAIVAAAGTLTVFVLYRIGRRVAGEATGLLAALLLAVAILHVRESHFAMTDVLMTLFVMLSLATLLRAADTGSAPWFAVAGLAGGLAASTKYSAVTVAAAMGVVQLQRFVDGARPWHARAWLPSVAFSVMLVLGFLAATPYALLDRATFATDLAFDFTHLSGGHANVDLGRGWVYHLTRSLPYAAGLSIFAAAIPGAALLMRHHARRALALLAFAAAFYLAIGSGATVFFRYILPLIPLVCLSAAVAVQRTAPAVARIARIPDRAALAALLAIVAGPALVSTVWMDVLLAKTDSRVLAGDWLNDRIQPGETLHDAGNGYTRLMVWRASRRWSYDESTNRFNDDPSQLPDWLVLYQSPVRAYTTAPASLRTLASAKYDLVQTVHATRCLQSPAVYDPQDAFFLPLSRFNTVERPGPTVLIYRKR